jgi:fermentation-respiration switch protein FrsA (DUF1100 family)
MTDDGLKLGAWFVPAAFPGTATTMIVFNGNGGNRALRAPLAAELSTRGIATLMVDYRGYAGNPGSPSEHGLASDARAALRYVARRADVDPARIVYFGESLGTGVAVRLAVEHPPLALILRSPYTSLVDMGRHFYPFLPVRRFLSDRFESMELIDRLTRPVLVIAAHRDSIVPSSQSQRLYDAAPEPKQLLMLDDVDHNDYELLAGARVIGAIVDFVDRAEPASPPGGSTSGSGS